MLQRYLVVWLLGSSLIAFYWPQWFPAFWDPFLASKPLLTWLIVVTMFAIGLMLPRDEVRQVFRRWPTVLGGTTIQYCTMPLLAYVMASLCGLRGDAFVGVIMVGSVPGAMASNVLTLISRGNTSYSVSLTTCATLLSPVAVPLILGVALRGGGNVDAWFLLKTSSILLATVVLPVVAGHLLGRRFPEWGPVNRRFGSLIANLAILWIIAVVVGRNRESLGDVSTSLLWCLLGLNLGGYTAGYVGGLAMRLPDAMRRALTLEVGMQNAGLGAVLATQLFPQQTATAIAPALYTFGCMLTGTLLARAWAGAGESLAAEQQAPSVEQR